MTNPVTKLEQFLVDSLVSSPLVPIGVNVMRLADSIDKEGVVQSSSNIIVSYTGGSSNIKNREPLVFEKSYIFKITFNCQDYLSTSAHDFALHLVDAATRTISNQVPFVDGVQVIEPFYSSDETFEGITENSQYVYSQTWRLLSEEVYPDVSLDPCVRRGNCKAVWPPPGVEASVPAGAVVTADGKIWEIAGTDECGETVFGAYFGTDGDLLLKWDDSILIPKEELNKWTLDTTGHITPADGKLEVWLRDADGNQIERIFYTDTGKKAARLATQLWRSPIDRVGCGSPFAETFTKFVNTSGTYAYVDTICAELYTNPLTSPTTFTDLKGGTLIAVLPDVKLIVGTTTFVQVVKTDLGDGGWVDESKVLIEPRSNVFPAASRYREEIEHAYEADDNTIL